MSNVTFIKDNALCTGCGACAGICPVNAVKIIENPSGFLVPEINKNCIHCKKCLYVCPSYAKNTPSLEYEDPFHGVCLDGYIGYANDETIRLKSQSGGIVTALLAYLIDNKIIDAAVVNKFDSEIRRPKAILAKSKEELLECCGSYYTQSSVVETILNNKDKKLAAVVLGCQGESLKKIEENYPEINKPLYTIGLVCESQYSGHYIDDLVNQSGFSIDEKINKFRFKSKEHDKWPGKIFISSNKRETIMPTAKRMKLKPVYECHRCLSCYNKMNVFSDITCGDPWNIHMDNREKGYTVVIARTDKGLKLLEDAKNAGYITINILNPELFIENQMIDKLIKSRYVTVNNIYSDKGWHFPTTDKLNGSISDEKLVDYKSMEKRLEYSRNFYLAKNTSIAKILSKKKKQDLLIKNIKNMPDRALKKHFKLLVRLFKKVIGKMYIKKG